VVPCTVQYPDATGAGAIDIAFPINFHAVGVPWPFAGHGAKDTSCGQGKQTCRLHVKGSNMSAAGVIDVEDTLVW
jgi:hypothetical protein